ncbi:MAG: phosphatase PAP2 family protein, partial [Ignavibacteriota bacterium]
KGVRITIACLLLVGTTDLLTNRLIKEIVARPRPCSLRDQSAGEYSWLRIPDGARGGYGFPSSHAVNNFAAVFFFVILFPRNKRIWWLFFPAVIVALSRVYLGLHYPSDVLAGMIIGACFGIGGGMLVRKFERHFNALHLQTDRRT